MDHRGGSQTFRTSRDGSHGCERHTCRSGAHPDPTVREARACCSSGLTRTGCGRGLARPTRRLRPGRRYGPVELLEHLGEGRWRLRLDGEPAGQTPLPPYINGAARRPPDRYQTVYARDAGSAAAPTAGLHFSEDVLARPTSNSSRCTSGSTPSGRFAADELAEHRLHGERYEVTEPAWERIRGAPRVLAVGTTTVRTLEDTGAWGASSRPDGALHHARVRLQAQRRAADELSPSPLDAARARDGVRRSGRDEALYRRAVEERYRFYSFGDALLVL